MICWASAEAVMDVLILGLDHWIQRHQDNIAERNQVRQSFEREQRTTSSHLLSSHWSAFSVSNGLSVFNGLQLFLRPPDVQSVALCAGAAN